jgi:aminoglycoside phosphotransferase (APT) family kinase protein
MREALSDYLGRPVTTVERITTGHSRAMYRVEMGDGPPLVLRMEQGGVFGTSSTEEARIMGALHALGFPVARIVAVEEQAGVLDFPFLLMEFVHGDPVPPGGERELSDELARDLVLTLDRLHRVDPEAGGLRFDVVPPSAGDATHAQIDRWYSTYRAAAEVVPLLEEAGAWLHHHAPGLDRLHVVHGDAGPGNFVARDGRVAAVTDFEFCHLGDPAEDWVFCAAVRGRTTRTREEWAELFRELAGFELDEEGWRYWEAFNLFKGACANLTALRVFADGVRPAPNLLVVGTTLHQHFLRQLVDLTGR